MEDVQMDHVREGHAVETHQVNATAEDATVLVAYVLENILGVHVRDRTIMPMLEALL